MYLGIIISVLALPILILGFYFGANSTFQKQKQFILPFVTSILLFQVIVIFLPQCNFKMISVLQDYEPDPTIRIKKQDDIFPMSLFILLMTFTFCLYLDKFALKQQQSNLVESQKSDKLQLRSWQISILLPLGLSCIFFSNFSYIGEQKNQKIFVKQLTLTLINFSLLNFCYGYIYQWIDVRPKNKLIATIIVNCCLLLGIIIGQIVQRQNFVFPFLYSCGCGIVLYVSTMLCMPHVFISDTEKSSKSQFLSIIIGFLVTTLYYPISHLMKV